MEETTFTGPPADTEGGIGPLTLGGLLADSVGRNGPREAVVSRPAGADRVHWTYDQLAEEVERRARALVARGLDRGTRVALLLGTGPDWVAWAFAVASAGGVVVPVNTMFEPPEIDWVLRHSDAAWCIHQARLGSHDYAAQLDRLAPDLPFLRHRICLGTEGHDRLLAEGDTVRPAAVAARQAELTPHDDAVITYTSGSTGRPKGVLHTQRPPALQSWRFAQQFGLDPTVRVWSAYPFFWTAGFCMVMGATLAAGGCLVLQERFEPGEALHLMEAERVTTAYAWPHQAGALEAHPDWAAVDLSALRQVDEASPLARHPSVPPPAPWNNRAAYGLTETFTIVSSLPAGAPRDSAEGYAGPILPGNTVRIVDPATGRALPRHTVGEIRVKGPTLMAGYVKVAPEDVFDVDGFFPTGDAGFMAEDHDLHWVGRTSDMIKTGGANVSPVEVDNALLGHPDLRAALTVGVPDEERGQIVVVCAVALDGSRPSENDVRDYLRGRLAAYKLPRRVLFFSAEELPVTGSEKLVAADLRRLATARLADERAGRAVVE